MISTVREFKEKSDNNKSKNTEKDFFKISPATRCYECQGYEHIAAKCLSPFKTVINDEVFIEIPKHDSNIFLKVTHKEFTVIRPLPSLALLSTPPSPPPYY